MAAAMAMGCGDDSGVTGGVTGDPCDSHADCQGLCLDPGGGEDPYCSDNCDPTVSDSCPTGYECLEVDFVGDVCVLTDVVLGELGDDCADGSECESGFCNGDVCSECEGDGDCPGAQTCEDAMDDVGYFVCEGGDGALGDACTEGADCASGFCNGDVCSECDGDGDCPGAQTCEDDMDGVGYFVCETTALGELGDACIAGNECESGFCNTNLCSECEGDGDCPGGGTCEDATDGVGYFVCEGGTLGELGDACTAGNECESGFCNGDVCSECEGNGNCPGTETCEYDGGVGYFVCQSALGALGDACTLGSECVSGFCNTNLCSECEVDGDCAGALTCGDDTGGVGYFVCEGGSGALGDNCVDGTDCASGYCYAAFGQNICSECEVDGDCAGSMTCNYAWGDPYATCGGTAGLGSACTIGTDCTSGFCNGNVCSECEADGDCSGGGTCTDDTGGVGYFVCAGGLGDDCTSGTDCNSGFCYDPVWPGQNFCSECEVDNDCPGNQTCVMGWQDDYATCS
jgi:hypothetical protein